MVSTGWKALLLAVVLLAAACSGADNSSDETAAEVTDAASELSTRDITQVMVVGADAEAMDAIESTMATYDIAPSLERMFVVSETGCDQQTDPLIMCGPMPESLGPTNGRRALVVLDHDMRSGAAAVKAMGDPLVIAISGPPDNAAESLGAAASLITFVPSGVSEMADDAAATFAVGVRDELAAFAPLHLDGGMAASRVTRFFDSRLQMMKRDSAETDGPTGVVPEPDVRWVLDLPDPIALAGSHERAVVVDGVVAVLGGDGVVRGIDSASGTVRWSVETDADPRISPASFAAAAGDTLLVATTAPGVSASLQADIALDLPDKSLLALDIRSGDVSWDLTVSGEGSIGHPSTDGDRVFLWVAEDRVDISFRALDISDGREIWRAKGEGVMGIGPPRVDSGEVWVGSTDGTVRGFDAQTGAELARFYRLSLGVGGAASRPAVTADRIFFGLDNGIFYAIDRVSGELVWSFETESLNLPSSPVVADDIVIFGSFAGGVYGLDIDSGEVRWRYDGGTDLFLSSVTLVDDTVYIASFAAASSVLALDARTGEPVWELPLGAQTTASPYVDGDTVYIQSPGKFWAIMR